MVFIVKDWKTCKSQQLASLLPKKTKVKIPSTRIEERRAEKSRESDAGAALMLVRPLLSAPTTKMKAPPTCMTLKKRKEQGPDHRPQRSSVKASEPREPPTVTTTTVKIRPKETESRGERGRLGSVGGTFLAIIQASENRPAKAQVRSPRDPTETRLYIYGPHQLKMLIQSCLPISHKDRAARSVRDSYCTFMSI